MLTITREVVLPHPRAAVWTALTDPDALADWLMPNDFRAELGHRFTLRTDPAPGFDGVIRCEVLEVRAPERLAYSWVSGRVDTRVIWDLAGTEAGTRLLLRHEGFGVSQLPVRMLLGAGWKKLLGRKLPAYLAGRPVPA